MSESPLREAIIIPWKGKEYEVFPNFALLSRIENRTYGFPLPSVNLFRLRLSEQIWLLYSALVTADAPVSLHPESGPNEVMMALEEATQEEQDEIGKAIGKIIIAFSSPAREFTEKRGSAENPTRPAGGRKRKTGAAKPKKPSSRS